MEFINQKKQNQRAVEQFVLIFYSFYNINLCIIMLRNGCEAWAPVFMLTELIASCVIFFSKYKNFRVRAGFTTVMMQLTFVLYASHVKNLYVVVPTFMVLTVLTAFYGISSLLLITAASALFVVFYHGVVIDTLAQASEETLLELLPQFANILCINFIIYFWQKKRNEGDEQMYKVIEALIDAEQSKDDFLSNISHEIRTPVNTICGMSEMALREHDLDKMREEIFDIRDAGHNLMTLVSDILDFSQLQKGKMDIEEETYNITSTINDIINMAMAKKGDKPVELIVDCDPEIPDVLFGDEKKIRRVIMNLVDNAVKFTNEGGVILHINARKETYGVNLGISVKDTGIGISKESMEKLFESFSQVDTRRNRQEGGVGLGLAISKALVQKMGGTITVRSHLGKGSVFRFVVPQKVLDHKPIAQVRDKERLNIAAYFNMEQFDMMTIRDEYSNLIIHMVQKLQVKCHVCRNLAELKRREEKDGFTHIFISLEEYQEDTAYFHEAARRVKIIVVIEHVDEKYITSPDIIRLYKPFYILPVVSILNGSIGSEGGRQMIRPGKFVTKNVHVLVVDDNQMNIRVIEGILKKYQIKVTYAISGRDALKLIENKCYDFVFMDHMMPEMDGIEVLHRIRDKVGHYYQNVPIIALTANAAPGNREMFLEEGFDDFVSKPIEISVLERVLKRNLPEEKLIYHTQAEKKEEETDKVRDLLVVGDLDTAKGVIYCGGKQAYLDILESCYIEREEISSLLERLYQKQDWENYIIKVHALKSSMQNIGAMSLFAKAKALEIAGKKDEIEYILKNHKDMIIEYQRVMQEIKESPQLRERFAESEWKMTEEAKTTNEIRAGHEVEIRKEREAEKQTETAKETESEMRQKNFSELLELSEEVFDKTLEEFENAMYALDGAAMLEILSKLECYQYYHTALKEKLIPIKRKVEMSDYMSAVDTISQVRENIREEARGRKGITEK